MDDILSNLFHVVDYHLINMACRIEPYPYCGGAFRSGTSIKLTSMLHMLRLELNRRSCLKVVCAVKHLVPFRTGKF